MTMVKKTSGLSLLLVFVTFSTLIGPDSPQFFLVPGFATHRELESFVEAGLSPYQAIEAATRNPAEYFAESMKASRDFGTVEVGSAQINYCSTPIRFSQSLISRSDRA